MKTIITLDKANQPYGFPQLDGSGNLSIAGTLEGTASWAIQAYVANTALLSADTVGKGGAGAIQYTPYNQSYTQGTDGMYWYQGFSSNFNTLIFTNTKIRSYGEGFNPPVVFSVDNTGAGGFAGGLAVTGSVNITGSVTIADVLTLPPISPLPSNSPTGSFAVSGSGVDCKPYFYNGTTWTSLF